LRIRGRGGRGRGDMGDMGEGGARGIIGGERGLDTEEDVNRIRGWKECAEVRGEAWVRGDGDVWTKITLLYDIHSKHW
jgi:hypothetical protein